MPNGSLTLDDQPYGGPITAAPPPTGLADFGPPQQPRSILGPRVNPGDQITPQQMPAAEKAFGKYEAMSPEQQHHHDTLQNLENSKADIRSEMMRVMHNPYDPQYGDKIARLHHSEGDIRALENREKLENPWGSIGSEHPGIFGKIGHAFGEIGNIAGEALAGPGVTSMIPGTRANLMTKEASGEEEAKQAETQLAGEQKVEALGEKASAAEQTAEAAKQRSEAAGKTADVKQQHEDTTEQTLPAQLANIIKSGGDLNSPEAQKIVNAIKATQKTPPSKFQARSGTLDGKPANANYDPVSGKYFDPATQADVSDRFKPAPSYAQVAPSLRTVTVMNDQNIPEVRTLTGRTIGVSPTGAYGHEMAQAGAVERGGHALIHELYDPQNREMLGQLSSYISQGTLGTPFADERAAKLSSELKTFAALQPALHGFRARTAQEAFEKIIGGLAQNPDATIGAIEGILNTAEAINPPKPGTTPNSPAAPGGLEVIRDASGRIIGIK